MPRGSRAAASVMRLSGCGVVSRTVLRARNSPRPDHLDCSARQGQADPSVAARDVPEMDADIRAREGPVLEKLSKPQTRLAAAAEILGRGLGDETADKVGAAPGQLLFAPHPLLEDEADVGRRVETGPFEASDYVGAIRLPRRRRHEMPGREIRVVHEEAPDQIVLVADAGRREAIGGEQQSRVLDAAAGEDDRPSPAPGVRARQGPRLDRFHGAQIGRRLDLTAFALRRTSTLSACSSSCRTLARSRAGNRNGREPAPARRLAAAPPDRGPTPACRPRRACTPPGRGGTKSRDGGGRTASRCRRCPVDTENRSGRADDTGRASAWSIHRTHETWNR